MKDNPMNEPERPITTESIQMEKTQDTPQHTKRILGRTLEWSGTIIWLLLGGLILLIWQFLLIACVMGSDSFNSHTPKMVYVPLTLLCLGVLCYPGVYIACLVISVRRLCRKPPQNVFYLRAYFFAGLPILYLVAAFAIFLLFGFLTGTIR